MDLDHLRAFLAVLDAGGFSRAAQVLPSTQPTLSRQVKALEDQLGQRLLDRLGRRVAPTPFGETFATGARDLLERADALARCGQEDPGRVRGELRVGVADSVVLSRFPQVVERTRGHHPDLHVHIKTATSPEILRWVRDGRLEAGLCMLPRAHPGLLLRPLWEDGFLAVAPPRHPLAGQRAPLSALAAERQIVIRADTLSYQALVGAYRDAGLSLVPDMEFDNFHLIAEFVAAGAGVGICSATVAEDYLAEGRLARVEVDELSGIDRRLGLVLPAERAPGRPLQALLADLEASVRGPG